MIALRAGDAVAEVVPERGAICSRLAFGNDEILYMDQETLSNPGKNVRGGIPVLFPIAGKPDPGSPYKQHGFARSLPWEPVQTGPSSLECRLAHDGWELLLTFTLQSRQLMLELEVHGGQPYQAGFHPYFNVAEKSQAIVETDASQVFDNVSGQTRAYVKPDFSQGEQDLHLLDHRRAGTVLHRPAPLKLDWSPDFTRMVMWTLPGKPFICVEPWTKRCVTTRKLAFRISAGG